MSLPLYDNAIIKNLREITADNRIFITPVDNLIRTIGKSSNDMIQLPMISVTRTGWSLLSNRPHTKMFSGTLAKYEEDTNKLMSVQVIPIRINYLLDVWSKTREENDNIMRELIWYYSTHPTLCVTVPHKLDMKHVFNIFYDDDIEDNSDIVSHIDRGEYFRQTISFYTNDAYLWKSSSSYPTYIVGIDLELSDAVGNVFETDSVEMDVEDT